MKMAAIRPQLLVNAQAAHGLEQQLIHALVDCLSVGSGDQSTLIERRHQDIMVRFERLLQAQPDRDMYVREICAELEVSERLLRSLCAKHLGMGPVRYDRLRRMSLVHRILMRGDGGAASVAEVARRYGFRQPGRFSANYRVMFGESPSATLRRCLGRYIINPTKKSAQMKVL
jgi:AraC-like DNA-binding protein